MNNKHLSWNKEINNNIIIASRAYFLHPGPASGYWPEKHLGHVYIILEPIVSARLTFVDDIVLYELCMLVTECCSESRMRHGHDEELRNGPEVKIDI